MPSLGVEAQRRPKVRPRTTYEFRLLHLLTLTLSDTQPLEDGRHVCPICDKSLSRKEDLDRHHKTVHEKEKYFCPHPGCTRTEPFTRKDNRDQHIRKLHRADPKQYPEPQNMLAIPNDPPQNVVLASPIPPTRKRRRDEQHTDEEADVEDVHEKCRRLEHELAQSRNITDRYEREMERLQNVNEALIGLIQTQMKQGKQNRRPDRSTEQALVSMSGL
jgi:uncharacterized Zn-finger protein